MLCKEIKAVYSENHTKRINTLFWQNVELLNVEVGGAYSYHWVLEGKGHSIRYFPSFKLLRLDSQVYYH
jgi:hypothetical protein